jgi:hypothetical protein
VLPLQPSLLLPLPLLPLLLVPPVMLVVVQLLLQVAATQTAVALEQQHLAARLMLQKVHFWVLQVCSIQA